MVESNACLGIFFTCNEGLAPIYTTGCNLCCVSQTGCQLFGLFTRSYIYRHGISSYIDCQMTTLKTLIKLSMDCIIEGMLQLA